LADTTDTTRPPIAQVYVPLKRRATLDPKKAQEIAESILQIGLQSPILVRQDGERAIRCMAVRCSARVLARADEVIESVCFMRPPAMTNSLYGEIVGTARRSVSAASVRSDD
jgi:hypothetical protein